MEIKGFWNGKIYGSERSGYSIYVDGVKTAITSEEKAELENGQAVKKVAMIMYRLMGGSKFDPEKVKTAVENSVSFFSMNEKLAPAVAEEAKNDGVTVATEELTKNYNIYNEAFLAVVEEKNKKREAEKKEEEKREEERKEFGKKIDEYIAENGTPDVIKNNPGYWNTKVYGNETVGYYVFIGQKNGKSKKIYLSDADKRQFGINN